MTASQSGTDSPNETTAGTAPRKSVKQRRKAEQRKQLITMVSILVLVAAVVGAVLAFNWWRNDRAGTPPQDQRIIAVVGEGDNAEEVEIPPYSACEIDDADCSPSEPFELDFKGQDTATLKIPQDVYDHDWAMLSIYDDPGANDETYHKANETTEVEISVASDKKTKGGKHPKLTVVEIHSLLIGRDADGEETPVSAIWSITPKKPKK